MAAGGGILGGRGGIRNGVPFGLAGLAGEEHRATGRHQRKWRGWGVGRGEGCGVRSHCSVGSGHNDGTRGNKATEHRRSIGGVLVM